MEPAASIRLMVRRCRVGITTETGLLFASSGNDDQCHGDADHGRRECQQVTFAVGFLLALGVGLLDGWMLGGGAVFIGIGGNRSQKQAGGQYDGGDHGAENSHGFLHPGSVETGGVWPETKKGPRLGAL